MSTKTIITFAAIAIVVCSAAVQRPINSLQAPLSVARPSGARQNAAVPSTNSFSSDTIRHFEQSASDDGSYKFAYETDAGVKVKEQGVQKFNGDVQSTAVAGSYSYVAPDGTNVQLSYVADENGFQPTGDHLPVPPAVPELIQRALLYIQSHSSSE